MAMLDTNTSNQFLSFTLRDEHFAVAIGKIREVLDVSTMTKIPRMPDYLNGVINLRGTVVPVIDLGYRLDMPPVEKTVNTCIMIVEINLEEDDETVAMGVLTDAVQEVLTLNPEEIEPPPKMGTNLSTDFIMGMGRQHDKFMIMLDIDKLLSTSGTDIESLQLSALATHDEATENQQAA